MRHVAALFLAAVYAPIGVHAEGYGPSLTVLLDFQEAASLESLGEMQREVQQVFRPSGLRLQIRLMSAVVDGESFEDLVLVKFRGSCTGRLDPVLIDERGPGPLAFAHTADGKVQPFGEVGCDSVRRVMDSALWGGQQRNRDQLFGRALGRVVAHELVHMVAQTGTHGRTGVFAPALSGSQLIAEHLELSREDCDRIRRLKPSR